MKRNKTLQIWHGLLNKNTVLFKLKLLSLKCRGLLLNSRFFQLIRLRMVVLGVGIMLEFLSYQILENFGRKKFCISRNWLCHAKRNETLRSWLIKQTKKTQSFKKRSLLLNLKDSKHIFSYLLFFSVFRNNFKHIFQFYKTIETRRNSDLFRVLQKFHIFSVSQKRSKLGKTVTGTCFVQLCVSRNFLKIRNC